MASVVDVRFEHYHARNTIGIHEHSPRLSWRIKDTRDTPGGYRQSGCEIELYEVKTGSGSQHRQCLLSTAKLSTSSSTLVPWPFDQFLRSRQQISVRVRVWDSADDTTTTATPWSEPSVLETGLLERNDWICDRIAAPWAGDAAGPQPEHLFRKEFLLVNAAVDHARLYITAQGVYEAEINGRRIGDYFLAPGWTAYDRRLQYQTYDVTGDLLAGSNCLGVRIAEGWFCGRIGFEGGRRNIWGPHPALVAQLEVTYTDGHVQTIRTDGSWIVTEGPIRLAEIYDGEKYDATKELDGWSSVSTATLGSHQSGLPRPSDWQPALVMPRLSDVVELTCGFGEPVRPLDVIKPLALMLTPSGKTIIDFGQNLVGYVRLGNIRGPRGHKITISHAEVLEDGELCTRPLRICQAVDEFTLRGSSSNNNSASEQYQPRFTFHGFRYAQIDGWLTDNASADLLSSVEAVVCHTDMSSAGSFLCSEPLLNKLYENVSWGMKGNFLSVPTDCPQRDERLGWTGDLALFAPTAVLVYDCFGMLRNWLIDVEHDQRVLGGVPPMVSPNATLPDPVWCRRIPCAIWHDVTILAPWALYQETGDASILAQQYNSMRMWMDKLPRNKTGATHLWDTSVFQLGDWLDPAAPPDQPWKSATDAKMVANMFLIQSLDLMSRIASILQKPDEQAGLYAADAVATRTQFHQEYVTANGRLVSDSQAAYALAMGLDILVDREQRVRAGARLAELVRKNNFRIGTGFAGTPFVCEALAATGHAQVAFSMLLERGCPSWLYTVEQGATTMWERWDSLLPDGRVNPGEMTSFNHYAFGAVAKFLHERVAGLRRVTPGWTECVVEPAVGATFTSASSEHVTPRGTISCSWKTHVLNQAGTEGLEAMELSITVPRGTTVNVVLPTCEGTKTQSVGTGYWSLKTEFKRNYKWPVPALKPKS
ncbi:alpha-L-rhamnosidase [Sporothrix schenckii 1099-18]|uniref:alpha-L-rhamnosidase n=1 Tax=Sporothrix schenckii 1099-18 TaxID=1397361 RepID=A0A0F2M627_SPOSC|nr:alpha-L-rhamnosidase [Sporothrix schenckii 1099-18]KJR83636.1 alpha-L-rhamnosidase [Sporothrix schenckii 1099-18]